MTSEVLFAAQVLLYAAFPFLIAFYARPVRLVLFYVYIAVVLVVGGFFGSVYSLTLLGDVRMSAGSVLYGALVLTVFMLVAGGHDARVIRNVVKIVVMVNLFKVGLLAVTAAALRSPEVVNPFATSASVFTVSFPVVLLGGLLIVVELTVLIVLFESISRRVRGRAATGVLHVALYVAVLALDGVLFPLLVAPTNPELAALVTGGVRTKIVLALAYAVPLAVFFATFRGPRVEGVQEPLRVQDLFVAPRQDLVHEVERQGLALEAGAERYRQLVESTGDAVVGIGPDARVLSWNRAAARIYRLAEADAVGRHAGLLLPALPRADVDALVAAVLAGADVPDLTAVVERDDGTVHVSLSLAPVRDAGRVVGVSAFGRDTTERHAMERALEHQALHDALTGLPNRNLVVDRLTQALAVGERDGTPTAVMFLDLDQFKVVNDASGHEVGDRLLRLVAERLQRSVRPQDTVARLGGDEFVLLCPGTDAADAGVVAERVLAELGAVFDVAGQRVYVTASVGIALAPPGDASTMLRQADTAMYAAKARGRGRVQVFDTSMSDLVEGRLALAHDLREALAGGGLELHYQPVLDVVTGRLVGVEALARWHHATRGWVGPDQFIPLAESGGIISELTAWALRRACLDGARALASGLLPPDGHVAVNLSGHDVGAPGLVELVRTAVAAAGGGFTTAHLVVEVTESVIMADVERAREVLGELRDLGVTVAVDDFGTGYSSLAYLRRLPASQLKIDRAFVSGLAQNPQDRALVASVVQLAGALGMTTVAEGVETADQRALLAELGCQAAQGWLWSPALRLDALADWVAERPAATGVVPCEEPGEEPAEEPRVEEPASRPGTAGSLQTEGAPPAG